MEENKRRRIEEQLRQLMMEDRLQSGKEPESDQKSTPIRVIRRRRGAPDVKIV